MDPSVGDGSNGIPGWFIALFVLVALIAVGMTVYRVSVARGLAQKSGMDPDAATRIALLENDGLSATYLASELKGQHPTPAAGAGAKPSTADRLRELEGLRAQGLVTEGEYAQRRTAILGEL